MSPADLWPKVYLGQVYESLGNSRIALQHYREILLLKLESPTTAERFNRLMDKEYADTSLCITEWRHIADKHPNAAVPLYYLGRAFESSGDVNEAAQAYAKALGLTPDFPEAAERLNAIHERIQE